MGKVSISDISDSIRSFAESREYIIEEESDDIERTFTICDRKPDSPVFSSVMQTIAGSHMLSDRIRLRVKIRQNKGALEANIEGDMLLNDWDLVNDRPKRKDAVRLERALEQLTRQLTGPIPQSGGPE